MAESLTPAVFHILLALVDEDRHGYGIMLEIAERTNKHILMGPGTLYGTLKRMIEGGLIEECGQRADPDARNERAGTTESQDAVVARRQQKLNVSNPLCD